jgi:hypothetical protein
MIYNCLASETTLIKNPPSIAFVKHASIAHGPRQVNNGALKSAGPTHANEPERPVTRLNQLDSETLYFRQPAHGEDENAPNELISQPVQTSR